MSETVDHANDDQNLKAQIENRTMQPDLCAIYEPPPEDYVALERWITAYEGSYIDLALMR